MQCNNVIKLGTQTVLKVKEGIWKKGVRKNTSAKSLGSCNRVKGWVYTKKRKGIFTVKRRERKSTSIHKESAKKKVYSTVQVAPNFTSTFCNKKEQKTKNGTRLSTYKLVDNKK